MDVHGGAAWSVSADNRGLTTSPPQPFTVTLTGRHHKNSVGKHLREFSSNTTQKRPKVHASGATGPAGGGGVQGAAEGSLTDTCPCLGMLTTGEGQARLPVPAVTAVPRSARKKENMPTLGLPIAASSSSTFADNNAERPLFLLQIDASQHAPARVTPLKMIDWLNAPLLL